ncbi:MAG: uracil-DNA glycosylase [Hydrogenovibrio sp.]|uniref:uracil-DNA glycosylase n=1 Tax=Hydrogenovibrio sp. TaxID=2065821 RepID=UPI0028700CD4|nr:uracil-DNA glycosylase [Hydrogenovibrio sp.]MDR9497655.1 uracil-DNA glycosylase [Hydrogenovibrio sp.]
MDKIDRFLEKLAAYEHSETVHNPYKDENTVNNLREYLGLFMTEDKQVNMLVGEAPGYLGCRITGIPFTSSEQLATTTHPILSKIKQKLKFSSIQSEKTANFMWDLLADKKKIPLLWNSFPFHPHNAGNPKSNRKPNVAEIDDGIEFLVELCGIFKPAKVASIGREGEKALKATFPEREILYIRHPSYGGKTDFIAGMKNFI